MATFAKGVLNSINPFSSKQGPIPTNTINRGMDSKYLTSMIGTPGAGKTTTAAELFLTARTLQQQLPDFYCDVDDRNSSIMLDISNIQRGHFPPKTKAYNNFAYQYGLKMWWGGKNFLTSKKSMSVPLCDIAGEDLAANSQYNTGRPDPIAFSSAMKLVEYVYNSDIFILIAPASRALLFEDDCQVEREDEDLAFDPDVNLASMAGAIFNRRRELNKPIKGVLLFLTKCDMIDAYVEKQHGWSLYKNDGDRQEFLNLYFPFTSMKLKALTSEWPTQIGIFPMFIQTKKNSDGTVKHWETGTDKGPMIDVEARQIKYSAAQCVEAINFMGKLIT